MTNQTAFENASPRASRGRKETDATLRKVRQIESMHEQKFLQALSNAEVLAERNPDSYVAQMLVAFLYRRARRIRDSIDALERALMVEPDSAVANFNLATCFMQVGEFASAAERFEKVRSLDPAKAGAALVLSARCLHRTGNIDDAVSLLEKAAKEDPKAIPALMALSHVLREKGDFINADRTVRRLLDLCRLDPEARRLFLLVCQRTDFHRWRALDSKERLHRLIMAYRERHGTDAFPWWPRSFILPGERDELRAEHVQAPGQWIVKRANLFGAHGTRIIDSMDQAPADDGWIVQRYISNPLLVRERKTSVRLYIAVTSGRPLRLWLYKEALVRFAPRPYRAEKHGDLASHLANIKIFEGEAGLMKELTDAIDARGPFWTLSRFLSELSKEGHDTRRASAGLRRLAMGFAHLLAESGFLDAQNANGLRHAYGPKIIGLDVMFDAHLNPWLMEMEHRPGVRTLLSMDQGRIARELIRLSTFPLLETEKDDPVAASFLRDPAVCSAQAAKGEWARSESFLPLLTGMWL